MSHVVDKFLRYVKIDTQSDPESTTFPSTQKQFDLAHLLAEELRQLGMQDVSLDENGYVMATLPANTARKLPTVGFIAHMDTSPDMPGANVKPRMVENYDGKDIVLNPELGVVLSPRDFPELCKYVGETLIVTDGTTLLGADDKAGIAEIMTAMEYLLAHPEIEHGTLKVAFTPDEEVGHGTDGFDVAKFGADLAYTLDGGEIGELEYENFNAAHAEIHIQGRNVHPGSSKNKMINAILIAMDLNAMLPVQERPAFTEKYEGFFHLGRLDGTVENARMDYIIRDHDAAKFAAKKQLLENAVAFANQKYGAGLVKLTLTDQYRNMKERIEPVMHVIDKAREAMLAVDVKPLVIPIRGGTDGAELTYKGIPTPNMFTGGQNFHGKYEYIPIRSMEKAVEVVIKLVELYAERQAQE